MELSKLERLLLDNQYQILSFVDPGNAKWYDRMREALQNGYEAAYSSLFNGIFDPLPAPECSFVVHTMAMFDALQQSYAALSDKGGIDQSRLRFSGFDGNNETEYMGYAQFLVEKEERFTTLQLGGDGFNSHRLIIPEYKAMLTLWYGMGQANQLTADQIRQILGAR
jgi:uncharacterized protein